MQDRIKEVGAVLGISRMRLLEYAYSPRVAIEVPARFIDRFEYAVSFVSPVHIKPEVRALSWWRCWFVKFQHIIVHDF